MGTYVFVLLAVQREIRALTEPHVRVHGHVPTKSVLRAEGTTTHNTDVRLVYVVREPV